MNLMRWILAPAVVAALLAASGANAAPCGGTYSYTGALVSCEIDRTGTYALDVFGAQGGGNYYYDVPIGSSLDALPQRFDFGGFGAHVGGNIVLSAGDKLWILVGGVGGCCARTGGAAVAAEVSS